jgi:hypothetical protein
VKTYTSNDEVFEDLQGLIGRLEGNGSSEAAENLRSGLGSLNGLTDGWAMLMESIERVLSNSGKTITSKDLDELEGMLKSVRRVVYRH